jgi:hypothetical protein
MRLAVPDDACPNCGILVPLRVLRDPPGSYPFLRKLAA